MVLAPAIYDGLGFVRRRRARKTTFEVLQFLLVTDEGRVGGGQEHSELRLSRQGTLNLQGQPCELGATSHLRPTLLVTSWWALF